MGQYICLESPPGQFSNPNQLLICSSFSRENGHSLLICSSLSTCQPLIQDVVRNLGVAPNRSLLWFGILDTPAPNRSLPKHQLENKNQLYESYGSGSWLPKKSRTDQTLVGFLGETSHESHGIWWHYMGFTRPKAAGGQRSTSCPILLGHRFGWGPHRFPMPSASFSSKWSVFYQPTCP